MTARSRISTTTSTGGGNKTITGNLLHTAPPSPTGFRQRISVGVLGVKGSLLSPSPSSANLRALAHHQDKEFKQENPVARLKLLLVRLLLTALPHMTIAASNIRN
jgi:hydroxymethylglutaryl-CoA reductase (NADPH)